MKAPADPAGHEQDGGHSGVLRDRVQVGGHAPRGGGSSHDRIGKSKALIGRATQRFAHDAGHFAGDQSPGDSQSATTTSPGVAVRRQRRSCGPRRLREAPGAGEMTDTMARQRGWRAAWLGWWRRWRRTGSGVASLDQPVGQPFPGGGPPGIGITPPELPINEDLTHLTPVVPNARVDSPTSLVPRAARLAAQQRDRSQPTHEAACPRADSFR